MKYKYPEEIRKGDFNYVKSIADNISVETKHIALNIISIIQNEMELTSDDINEFSDFSDSKIDQAIESLQYLKDIKNQMVDKFQEVR